MERIVKCSECKVVMREICRISTGNCDSGCCPSSTALYQCDNCKRVESD